ncbi:MAG: hypothetical protein WCF84_16035 [Anaerolineae bacterium]
MPRNWLLALAGVMWTGVGVMLCFYAVTWLEDAWAWLAVALGLLGITISVVANRWKFSELAIKNIDRIFGLPDRACVFSFQAWKGYVIIVGMVALGLVLRNSPLPKPYLAVIYLAVGGALLQASLHYYRRLAQATVRAQE